MNTNYTFEEVCDRTHARQAQFFLNAFWAEHSDSAEQVYRWTCGFNELAPQGKEGSELDEFCAHKFLEHFGQTMTVLELRKTLREIDINKDGKMSMIEFLVFHFKTEVSELMSRPQGVNEQLIRAQDALEAVQKEISAIENRKSDLETKSRGDGVFAKTAKAELYALLNEDPLSLNRALITAGAAVRKAKRCKDGQAMGALWWLDHEIEEAKKYKPRGGVRKASIFN